ncbi:hypothetical protein A2U01_0000098, partial [Trifolium medium]|nr:hypothetical protein [Trifolium medium]
GKGILLEGTPVGVSQDLMGKFATAVVNLGDDVTPTMLIANTPSSDTETTPQSTVNVEGASTVRVVSMGKFATAAVNLGDDVMPTMLMAKTSSCDTVKVEDASTVRVAVQRKKSGGRRVSPQIIEEDEDEISPTEDSPIQCVKGQQKKSVAKRVSPVAIQEDEDDNTPIKLLKKAVKIEKIP